MSRKRLFGLLVSLLGPMLFGFALVAHADTVYPDPNMDVTDPLCTQANKFDCPNPIGPGGSTTFSASAHGGGIFTFTNINCGTGFPNCDNNPPDPSTFWRSVSVTETGIAADTITCQFTTNQAFFSCAVFSADPTDPTQLATIVYTDNGCPSCAGIGFREEITVNLNNSCPDITGNTDPCPTGDTGGWIPGQQMTITPNAPQVPEPASVVLLASGAATVLRRWRRHR